MSLTGAGIVDVTITGVVTGSGASGQVALWSGASAITGDAGCTWTGTGNSFVMNVGGGLQINTGGFGAGGWASFWGASNGGVTMGSGNLIGWDSATSHAGYNRTGIDLAISRVSAGTLLVEDGSGNARDIKVRTATITTLPAYANNAAASGGGLVAGDLYAVTGSDPRQVAVVF